MSAGTVTTTTQSALLKVVHQPTLNYRGVAQCKFWGMLSKDSKFSGRHKERVVAVTPGGGGSSNFENALAARGTGDEVTFTLSPKPDYVVLSVEEQLFKMGKVGMIRDVIQDQLNRKGKVHGMMISRRCWGENGSALGRLASSGAISTTTITLEHAYQANNFEPGFICEFADNSGSSSNDTAARTGSLTVSSRDITAGTVTFTQNVTTGIAAAANSDYVFQKGEHKNCWSGVLGWCPTSDPTDTFLGYDRSTATDIHRVSGYRPSTIYADKSTTVGAGIAEFQAQGLEVEYVFCNSQDYEEWQRDLGTHVKDVQVPSKWANVYYKGILINTSAGETKVLADPWCPKNVWVGTNMDIWKVNSVGEIPSMPGPNDWKTEAAADARQARLASYAFLDNEDPGTVIVGTWS